MELVRNYVQKIFRYSAGKEYQRALADKIRDD
jgi:hypothetical protein